MLDQVLSLFDIKPDIDLNLMEENQELSSLSSNALLSLTQIIDETKPDLVLVQGDTTTAMVSALAAFYKRVPIGHVEAGLRTYDNNNPFPEEVNRRIISILAFYHFAPTQRAIKFLLAEGVPQKSIFLTGNTVIDALLSTLARIHKENYVPEPLSLLSENNHDKLVLVTAHRRESFGAPLQEICEALKIIVKEHRDVQIIYPVHLNPNVSGTVYSLLGGQERIHLISPVDYKDLCYLMGRSYLILTDSGGIQEEAPSLGKPVLVMRQTTERPEAIEAGVAKLVGTTRESIINSVGLLLGDTKEYRKMASCANPFGDGKASERIVNILFGRPYEPFQSDIKSKGRI
jgi:UDP-N-acetylglucosamine 2-epimerase (non-hydrolysing)